VGARTFHILTRPSRDPVASVWNDRPQVGAHDTDVIAYLFSFCVWVWGSCCVWEGVVSPEDEFGIGIGILDEEDEESE
jgi:hypothetical protein